MKQGFYSVGRSQPVGVFSRTGFSEPADVARWSRQSEQRGSGFRHCGQHVACQQTSTDCQCVWAQKHRL